MSIVRLCFEHVSVFIRYPAQTRDIRFWDFFRDDIMAWSLLE